MAFSDEVKRAFKVAPNHEPRVILVGATDKENFGLVWSRHGLDDETADMDENASKQGMSSSPVFVVISQGTDGHVDAEISLPLQMWSAPLRMEGNLRDSKDLQRITDWLAGFMEPFCMNNSVSALNVQDGKMMFGGDDTIFNMDEVMKNIRPKREKSELMSDALDIGSVEDILAGQMTVEQIERVGRDARDAKEPLSQHSRLGPSLEEEADEENRRQQDVVKEEQEKSRITQQEIVDKYGFKALEELLERTGKELLVPKPRSKKV